MNRRKFLLGAATAAAVAGSRIDGKAAPRSAFSAPERKFAFDQIELGPDKIRLSRLAMGTGTSGTLGSSHQTRKLGVRGITSLYQFGYDNGVTFWDSADQYGSHPHVARACEIVGRDNVTITSKMPPVV